MASLRVITRSYVTYVLDVLILQSRIHLQNQNFLFPPHATSLLSSSAFRFDDRGFCLVDNLRCVLAVNDS